MDRSSAAGRRVALVQQAGGYVGPSLCRLLADDGHDLVVGDPRPGLVDELRVRGAAVEAVETVPGAGPGSLGTASGWQALVGRAVETMGRLDAAALAPPAGGPGSVHRGRFVDAVGDDLRAMYGYRDATFHALQTVLGAMWGRGGQVLVFTSDAGVRPEAGWSLYGAVRAGQTHLVRAVALEHAAEGVCINAIGSKNAVFEGFPGMPSGSATDTSSPGRGLRRSWPRRHSDGWARWPSWLSSPPSC